MLYNVIQVLFVHGNSGNAYINRFKVGACNFVFRENEPLPQGSRRSKQNVIYGQKFEMFLTAGGWIANSSFSLIYVFVYNGRWTLHTKNWWKVDSVFYICLQIFSGGFSFANLYRETGRTYLWNRTLHKDFTIVWVQIRKVLFGYYYCDGILL